MPRVNLFNHTDEQISDVVGGAQLVVPPRNHVSTTEKKANEMIRRYPGKLDLKANAGYTEEDYRQLDNLKKSELVKLAKTLMSGQSAKPSDVKEGQNQEAEAQGTGAEAEQTESSASA